MSGVHFWPPAAEAPEALCGFEGESLAPFWSAVTCVDCQDAGRRDPLELIAAWTELETCLPIRLIEHRRGLGVRS